MIKMSILSLLILITTAYQSQSLMNTKWSLISIDDLVKGSVTEYGKEYNTTLVFGADSVFRVQLCGDYTGRYSFGKDQSLKMINDESKIRPECIGSSDFQKKLISSYEKAVRYKLVQNQLFIFTSDKLRLKFETKQ